MNGPGRQIVDGQRDRLLADIEELKENRLTARKDARSGNPAKAAQGKSAAAEITKLINARNEVLALLEVES